MLGREEDSRLQHREGLRSVSAWSQFSAVDFTSTFIHPVTDDDDDDDDDVCFPTFIRLLTKEINNMTDLIHSLLIYYNI